MLKRIATVSRVVVVHNPAAAAVVRKHAPDARVVEIPHLFPRPALPVSRRSGPRPIPLGRLAPLPTPPLDAFGIPILSQGVRHG